MSPNTMEIILDPDTGKKVSLATAEGVFTPTGTSYSLIKAVKGNVSRPCRILDLGCGIGIVGIALHELGLIKPPLYASDLVSRPGNSLAQPPEFLQN